MKIPFKKVGVLTLCCALCFTLLRIMQIFFCLEPSSGFFKNGYVTTGTELSIVIFAFAIICFIFSFSEKKVPKEIPKPSLIFSIGYIFIGAILVADLIFFPFTFSAAVWQSIIYYLSGAITAALAIFTGISYFFNLDFLSFFGFKDGRFPPLFSVVPLIFWIIRTIIFFVFYAEIAVISDLVFDIIAQLAVMILLLYLAFLKNSVEPVKAQKRILPFSVFAFLSTVCCGLPHIFLAIFGMRDRLHALNINHFTMLGVSIFLVVFYFSVFEDSNLKEKTKKHVKEKGRFIG